MAPLSLRERSVFGFEEKHNLLFILRMARPIECLSDLYRMQLFREIFNLNEYETGRICMKSRSDIKADWNNGRAMRSVSRHVLVSPPVSVFQRPPDGDAAVNRAGR